jgi:hypothetical protein
MQINEQIEKFSIQAGFNVYMSENLWPEKYPAFNTLKEKFAELIVKECIELCDGNHEHKNHTDTLFSKGVTTGIQLSQQAIKTHFGIKE